MPALPHRASNVRRTTAGFYSNLIRLMFNITFARLKLSDLCHRKCKAAYRKSIWYYYYTNYKSSTDTMCYLFISCTETYLPTVMVWHVYSLWWGRLSDFCVGLYRGARIYPPPPSPQMLQSSCGTRRKLCILNMHKLTLCSLLGLKRPVLTCVFYCISDTEKKCSLEPNPCSYTPCLSNISTDLKYYF